MFRRIGCRDVLIVSAGLVVALLILVRPPQRGDAPLPTLAVLGAPTDAPSMTPEATTAPTDAPTAAAVMPSATLTDTPQPTLTTPPSQTPTDAATNTPDVTGMQAETYYAAREANLRDCARTSCERVGTVRSGTPLTVDGVIEGEEVTPGNGRWYRVQYMGRPAYVYSELVRQQAPAPTAPAQSVPVQPLQPAQPASQWNCSGDRYNCSDFSSRAELMSYFNACPGDPSKLDANNDGVPCESLR